MEALARIVFERTPQGLMATKVLDDSGVPKRLRTLLLAVDGRTPVAQFVPFLTALAPLSEKFEELERLGLLRRKGQVSAEAVERFSRARETMLLRPSCRASTRPRPALTTRRSTDGSCTASKPVLCRRRSRRPQRSMLSAPSCRRSNA